MPRTRQRGAAAFRGGAKASVVGPGVLCDGQARGGEFTAEGEVPGTAAVAKPRHGGWYLWMVPVGCPKNSTSW